MKTHPFKNRIVIVGADHHNTLAAIRAFGQENCDIVVVVHGHNLNAKQIEVFSSKYVNRNQTHVIENDKDELLNILHLYGDSQNKTILFPCSDFAEMVFDSNYNKLSAGFMIPGFVGAPGKVCEMMDKWEQYLFAQKLHIAMAPTFLISLDDTNIPETLTFPCIVKPRVSAFGAKSDIAVCEDMEGLLTVLNEYRNNLYSDCLVQFFLKKDYEANSLGFVLSTGQKSRCVGAVAVKIREQLESATCFAVFVSDLNSPMMTDEKKYAKLIDMNRRIVQALQNEGYNGQYDIEYLIVEDTVYLNEINFRHSGNGYALVHRRFNAPYLWACGVLGCPDNKIPEKCIIVGSHFMAELSDKSFIKRRVITVAEWMKDIKKTDSFAIFNAKDLRATSKYYCRSILYLMKRTMNCVKNK